MKKKIAIFASGNGTNFEALAQACADGRINAEVALCITDKPSLRDSTRRTSWRTGGGIPSEGL